MAGIGYMVGERPQSADMARITRGAAAVTLFGLLINIISIAGKRKSR